MRVASTFSFLKFIVGVKLADNAKCSTSHTISVKEVSDPCHEEVYENIKSPCDIHNQLHVGLSTSVKCFDVATLTDICHIHGSGGLPEIDLVSLIEEQLPRYTLRTDSLTDFSGYGNWDWTVQTPCLAPDINLDLSSEFVKQTLDYFVMSGERLMQMTRTYKDIGAVTLLLEEKERDLELAARIGQTLLTDKCTLLKKNEGLEEQLHQANEKIAQLKHNIAVKDALLQFYVTNDHEECDSPSIKSTVSEVSASASATIDVLQRKIRTLENENVSLLTKIENISSSVDDLDVREAGLVGDCVRELREASDRMNVIHDELGAKSELLVAQQHKIEQLMLKIVTLEKKINELMKENVELHKRHTVMQETQQELVSEITYLEEKYTECLALLHEAQEEVRDLQKMKKPGVIRYHYSNQSPYLSGDSLSVQIENSIRKNLANQEQCRGKRILHAMQTVRMANMAKESDGSDGVDHPASPWSTSSSDGNMRISGSLWHNTNHNPLQVVTDATPQDNDHSNCHSPESYMSTGSGNEIESRTSRFRCPKLQIVKPLEGSETLHKWRSLATPHLASVLEQRPGVQIKGQHITDCIEEEEYSISDIEEDDDTTSSKLVKNVDTTSLTYTYTVSKITHPLANHVSSTATTISRPRNCVRGEYTSPQLPAVNCTSHSLLTTLDNQQISQNVASELPSSIGAGRLSELLRRLGFLSSIETVNTSRSDVFLNEKLETNSIPTCSYSSVAGEYVVRDCSDALLASRTTDVIRRCGAKQIHASTDIGLNTVTSLKRRTSARSRKVGASFGLQSFSSARPDSSSGVHLRNQVISRPVYSVSPLSDVSTFSEASIPANGSITINEVFSASHGVCDLLSYREGANVMSSFSVCQEAHENHSIPSIIVTPQCTNDIRNYSVSEFSLPSQGVQHRGLLMPSAFTQSTSPPRRPCSLNVTSTWDYPSSCRSSCVLTSSLSTVVHSRVGICSTAGSD